MALGKIQSFENHLLRDDKLTLNQRPSGLCIGVKMLTQKHKVLAFLNIVFSISVNNVINFLSVILFCFYVL